jgi:transposase
MKDLSLTSSFQKRESPGLSPNCSTIHFGTVVRNDSVTGLAFARTVSDPSVTATPNGDIDVTCHKITYSYTKTFKYSNTYVGIGIGKTGDNKMEASPVIPSYPQDWVAYNEAQTNEKLLFLQLLGDLTAQVPVQERTGAGRPPADFGEMIFACCLKIYLTFSSRRAVSDLKMAQQLEYIGHTPHFNTILKYLNDPNLTATLTKLIEFSSLPLKQLEDKFAVDSTGFSTSVFARWYGTSRKHEEQRTYVKAHVMCGVRTNVISSIEVTPGTVSDYNMFPALVESTAKRFQMKEVSADKGYSSRKCMDIVNKHGAIPYIAFRKHSRGLAQGSQTWRTMFVYFRDHKEQFMAHYHLRSNVESVFSMMKRKQGTFLRSRKGIAQMNEILCKALVHNICVLIQEMFESGVHVDFQSLAEDELMCKTLP